MEYFHLSQVLKAYLLQKHHGFSESEDFFSKLVMHPHGFTS